MKQGTTTTRAKPASSHWYFIFGGCVATLGLLLGSCSIAGAPATGAPAYTGVGLVVPASTFGAGGGNAIAPTASPEGTVAYVEFRAALFAAGTPRRPTVLMALCVGENMTLSPDPSTARDDAIRVRQELPRGWKDFRRCPRLDVTAGVCDGPGRVCSDGPGSPLLAVRNPPPSRSFATQRVHAE